MQIEVYILANGEHRIRYDTDKILDRSEIGLVVVDELLYCLPDSPFVTNSLLSSWRMWRPVADVIWNVDPCKLPDFPAVTLSNITRDKRGLVSVDIIIDRRIRYTARRSNAGQL